MHEATYKSDLLTFKMPIPTVNKILAFTFILNLFKNIYRLKAYLIIYLLHV